MKSDFGIRQDRINFKIILKLVFKTETPTFEFDFD